MTLRISSTVILNYARGESSEIYARLNYGHYADVHATVGFLYVHLPAVLAWVGYFDAIHFPVAYGEETDFCYRAGKAGWRHRIAGDAYVEHLEVKSFGEHKQELKQKMASAVVRLHPNLADYDQRFAR